MKTRDRILLGSLELFNNQGERAVTTNHLAAHLGISPGNLYYHFDNKKAIIRELYDAHQQQMMALLKIPEGRPFTITDKAEMMEKLVQELWSHQFLYRDIEHMLVEDPELANQHRLSFKIYLDYALKIHQALADAGLQDTTEAQRRDLSYNAWIIVTNWITFIRCTVLPDTEQTLSPALIKRGVYQVLIIEQAFMTPEAVEEMSLLAQTYYTDIDALLLRDPATTDSLICA